MGAVADGGDRLFSRRWSVREGACVSRSRAEPEGARDSLAGLAAGFAKGALDAARRRIDHDAAEIRALEAELSALSAKHRLDAALGDFVLFEWLRDNASLLAGDGRLVFITGWTSADGEEQLQRDLERLGATCLVRLPPAPPGSTPPLMLRNPGWVRPFEIFALMVGMPNRHEADPSVFLAVVTPLLFGFMFGDIGQGLVLTIAGVILGRRMPVLRLLVPGGVVAMIFGALFGSVFGFEAVPALWVRPLDEPVTLLAVTLGGGAVLMTLGLVISAIEARWRGESVRWWLHEAGLAAAYLSIVVAFFCRQALWGAPVGAACSSSAPRRSTPRGRSPRAARLWPNWSRN